jgi:hypothetical protein
MVLLATAAGVLGAPVTMCCHVDVRRSVRAALDGLACSWQQKRMRGVCCLQVEEEEEEEAPAPAPSVAPAAAQKQAAVAAAKQELAKPQAPEQDIVVVSAMSAVAAHA